MNAPADRRGPISDRVMGSRMAYLAGRGCGRALLSRPTPVPSEGRVNRPPEPSTGSGGADQRPRRERALKEAAEDDPARAASSARVRAGPDARPEPPDLAAPPEPLRPPEAAAPPEDPRPDPPRRRPPPLPWGCGSTTGAGST